MNADWLKKFDEKKALLKGHFLLSSGKHSEDYFQCALILQYPELAEQVAFELAGKLDKKIDVVISPALGGIIIGHEMARQLKTRAVFTERQDGIMKLRRGFSVGKDERVLVVEDVVTTGKSTREVIDAIKEYDANVQAVACVVDRTAVPVDFGVPVFSIVKLPLRIYQTESCPLCGKNIPLVKPGSREQKL